MSRNDEKADTESPRQPNQNDVLLGRAANVFHHAGNRRYRHIIALNLRKYKEAKSRLDKMVLIRQVTEQILDHGRVKFLRLDNKTGEWRQVPVRTAQDKVSHALRDGINKPIFSPLMMSVPESVTAQMGTAAKEDQINGVSVGLADRRESLPILINPSGRWGRESLQRSSWGSSRLPPEQDSAAKPPLPGIRLDTMNAASAASRAALMQNLLGGERRASAPTQMQTSPMGLDFRRSSAPSHVTPPASLNPMGRARGLPPLASMQPRHMSNPWFQNMMAPPMRAQLDGNKNVGGNPYVSANPLQSLKGMQQLEIQKLAQAAQIMRPQHATNLHAVVLQELQMKQQQGLQMKQQGNRDKQFLDTLVQQYRAKSDVPLPADLAAATSRVAAAKRQSRSRSEESLSTAD